MKLQTFRLLPVLVGLASAVPAPLPQSFPSGPNIVQPTTISQYNVWTGAIDYDTASGKIFKNGISPDITTLVTFELPAASQGLTCAFNFYEPSTPGGSGLIDVFTSLQPATGSTTSWPPGNQRNQDVGRLDAQSPGNAIWVAGFPNTVQSFPCPTGTWAIELVGVYDVDDIEWAEPNEGPYLQYS
jgi:hypothetical protein